MSSGLKNINLIGNVGADPAVINNPDGSKFATFNLAVNLDSSKRKRTDWLTISCNTGYYELATKYIKKGMKLYIEGFPTSKAYINKLGIAVAEQYVFPTKIVFLNSGSALLKESSQALPPTEEQDQPEYLTVDDIPEYQASEFA